MAEPDPLLDDDLNEADRRTVDAIENPLPQTGDGPEPSDLDEIAPEAPVAPPSSVPLDDNLNEVKPPEPLPGAPETPPGMAPVPGSAEDIKARELTAEGLSKKQADLDVQTATTNAGTARQIADAARDADEDARLERADYLQRRQEAERDLQAKTKRLEGMRIVDPRTGHSLKSTLAVAFGNLGAAFRSAGGGDSKNHVLDQLQQQWHNDVEIQKANIAAARDNVIQARTNLRDADEGRRLMTRDADARLLARYNVALKQGEASLRNQGMTQAQIDGDKRIMSLRAGAAQALAQARKDDDAHALNQARIEALKAKAARDAKKAKGGGAGGGGAGGDRALAVAEYLRDNPGDIPGAMRVAGPGFDSKKFDKIVANSKPTESQAKDAKQAKVGLDAIDAIEKSGYKPSREEIQKWINNQRLTAQAAERSLGGAALTVGQWFNLVPQSEVEGLSPEAQTYFANVRRYVEPIARSQSGAAISASEWENFFNQYGPNSAGGIEAAKRYLQATGRGAGVGGQQVHTSAAGAPEKKPAATGGAFVPGEVRKLKNGSTVRITSPDGDYEVISKGRKADIKL